MSDAINEVSNLSPLEKRKLLGQLIRQKASKAKSYYPLSYGQRSQWVQAQLVPASAAFAIPIAVHVRSSIDVSHLRSALQALVDRHAILRTTYLFRDGEPVQCVQAHMDVGFRQEDASTWDEAKLNRQLQEELDRPFLLDRGPILRVVLFSRSREDHILLLTVHHIAMDFWSIEIVVDELRRLYFAKLNDLEVTLPDLPADYNDFVQWQAKMLGGPEGERLLNYWKKKTQGELPSLDLPSGRPWSQEKSYQGCTRFFRIDDDLLRRLKNFTASEQSTLYMTTLAAMQLLLHRYTGQEEIIVVAPTSGRNRPEFSNIVGCFAEGVIVRVNVTGNLSFRDLLGRVRTSLFEAIAHQDYPMARLLEQVRTNLDTGVLVGWDKPLRLHEPDHDADNSPDWFEFDRVLEQTSALNPRLAMFDLLLIGIESGKSLSFLMQGSADCFTREDLSRTWGHYLTLLDNILRTPDEPIDSLPLMKSEERGRMLDWATTQVRTPVDICLHERFEQVAAEAPDHPALVCGDHATTYREVNRKSNQLARLLQDSGIGPEMPVGLCLKPSIDLVVGMLGILKAGAAIVPLDPESGARRIQQVVEDSQFEAILVHSRSADLPGIAVRCICVDEPLSTLSEPGDVAFATKINPHSLAAIIYRTIPSNGPVGVLLEHRSILSAIESLINRMRLGRTDRVLWQAKLDGEMSLLEVLGSLCAGATLVLPSDETATSLPTAVAQQEVSVLFARPGQLALLNRKASQQHSLRLILTKDEALSIADLHFTLENTEVVNCYGMAEASGCLASHSLTRNMAAHPKSRIPVGRPLENSRVYILDSRFNPVPVNVVGEIYAGGMGLARGYLNREKLMSAHFVPDPYAKEPGAVMFKTGDLGRFLIDGSIEHVGKVERQVRVQGYRVCLDEVESLLEQHPQIARGVVVAHQDASESIRLVAYVVANPAEEISIGELKQFLKVRLPRQKVPSAFRLLEDLPCNDSGQVDFDRLRSLYDDQSNGRSQQRQGGWERPVHANTARIESVLLQHPLVSEALVVNRSDGGTQERPVAYVIRSAIQVPLVGELREFVDQALPKMGPRLTFFILDAWPLTTEGTLDREALPKPDWATSGELGRPLQETEKRLLSVFESVLGVSDVGVHESFFELGGNSVTAAELVFRVREVFDVDLELSTLFLAPTVASMAKVLESAGDSPASSLVPIQPHGDLKPLFCIHPAGGQVLAYRSFASALSSSRPVYGIQSCAMADAAREHATVEAMARAYAELIRTKQPDGPYYLLGHSMGGLVATHVAHALESDGHKIAFIGLLDARFPSKDVFHDLSELKLESFQEIVMSVGYNVLGPSFATLARAWTGLDSEKQDNLSEALYSVAPDQRYQVAMDWLDDNGVSLDLSPEVISRHFPLLHKHMTLFGEFRPVVIEAPLHVWWAKEVPGWEEQTETDWSKYARGEVYEQTVDGNHFSMLQSPNVERLATSVELAIGSIKKDVVRSHLQASGESRVSAT